MTTLTVTPETMLPELFQVHPEVRAVFDRHGLKGCGGRNGPAESVRFFSKTHGVEEEGLLEEVHDALRGGTPPQATATTAVDTIYRRYFSTAILVALTAGATWGAWLLLRIGMTGAFTSGSIHEVNAHGHAQIFGWVGLFIMGFAYQAFPRMWQTDLVAPRLAVPVFSAMLVGLILRVLGMTFAGTGSWALVVAMGGGALETAAVTAFAAQIVATFRRSGAKWKPYVGFAAAALGWFVLMSAADAWHAWNTMTAATQEDLLRFVALYQAPLRDIQIHGLALFMILGVSLRMLPAFFDARVVPDRRAWTALGMLLAGVIGEAAFFIVYRITKNHAWSAAMLGAWMLLAVGTLMVAWSWKLWRPLPVADRSAKFVRIAYGWLALSLAMMLLFPVYLWATGIPFSHAYYGAVRHAITVGFISLMIMGFSAKVVPALNGVDPAGLSKLWGPFLLVNVGCFLRVTTQTLTDLHSGLFAVIGLSGLLEVSGLAWWGTGLIAIILRGKREERADVSKAGAAPAVIEPGHRVAEVLDWYPQTEHVFRDHGFTAVGNGFLRRTLARRVSLAQAASLQGIDVISFVNDLNAVVRAGE